MGKKKQYKDLEDKIKMAGEMIGDNFDGLSIDAHFSHLLGWNYVAILSVYGGDVDRDTRYSGAVCDTVLGAIDSLMDELAYEKKLSLFGPPWSTIHDRVAMERGNDSKKE